MQQYSSFTQKRENVSSPKVLLSKRFFGLEIPQLPEVSKLPKKKD